MSGSGKHTLVVALNGENYPTWKLQCKMALVREGLWGFVSGTEVAPEVGTEAEAKYLARRDQALATIVLAVETSLLYLLGDLSCKIWPWQKVAPRTIFCRKKWPPRPILAAKSGPPLQNLAHPPNCSLLTLTTAPHSFLGDGESYGQSAGRLVVVQCVAASLLQLRIFNIAPYTEIHVRQDPC